MARDGTPCRIGAGPRLWDWLPLPAGRRARLGGVGMEIEKAQRLWSARPGWLNTASYGLPPQPAWEAMQAALADWRVGATSWEGWDEATGVARRAFARLIGVPAPDVAVGSQVSQLIGPVAAALPDGARVVAPDIEFTSNLFPWLVQQDRLTVTTVPTGRLLAAIAEGCDAVAFSLVQSATGEVADYPAIVAAARDAGALVVVDATQACGWLPFDGGLADVVAVGGYKWLMGPRGTAFAYLSPAAQELTRPTAAGWYAGAEVHDSYYGPPLRLAADARRFDTSPAWFSWVGAAPAPARRSEPDACGPRFTSTRRKPTSTWRSTRSPVERFGPPTLQAATSSRSAPSVSLSASTLRAQRIRGAAVSG